MCPKVTKTSRYLADIDVPRDFHFHEKSRFALEVFGGERRPTRPREPGGVVPIPQKMEEQAKIPSPWRSPPPCPLSLPSQSLYFPFFSGIRVLGGGRDARVHQRRSETGNRPDVSAATRRNSRRVERNSLRNPPRAYTSPPEAAEILRGNK